MIDHLSITTTDLDRAQAFYDAALGALGYPRVNRRAAAIGYGVRDRSPDAPPYISIYRGTGKLVPDNRRAAAIGYGVRDRSPDAPPYISIYLCTGKLVPDNRHWCFRAKSRAAVRAFHQAALASGGSDDGPPGLRPNYHPDYYGAFVRDPDGNRIEAVTHQREDQK